MKLRIALVILSLILSIVIGVVIANGNGGEGKKENGKSKRLLIGLSMDTQQQTRWQTDRDVFIKRANELGADVLVQSANSDDIRQMHDVEGLISRGVDALVIIPHNGAQMAKAVKIAHEAGIPVLSYDRIITGCDLDLYISFDNVRVGEMQAKYLVDHLPTPGKGRIIRIYGAKTDNNAFLLKEGQDKVLKPYIESGDIKVIHQDWAAEWSPEKAKKIVNAAITNYGTNFDGILASNDGTAGGAIQALKEEGIAGKVIVTGQDAEQVACQRIVAGTQSMTIYKPIKVLAAKGAEAAVALAKGKPLIVKNSVFNDKIDVPSILLDVIVVTKANLDSTVIKDGFHTREEIYGANVK